ncbi:MAG: thiazole synthase [Planctomycetaceae bacterium]
MSATTRQLDPNALVIGGKQLQSRLIVGTGKYATYELMQECLEASGADVITVAVRRERLVDKQGRSILDFIDLSRYTILPNTAGCFSADDAVRVARLGREILLGLENPGADWVKLEVLGDTKTLLPDPIATLHATERLVADGFNVLCYTTDDPITARRLKEAGAASVMPAGSPIGSGQGVLNPNNIRICLEYLQEGDAGYPVIIDAGVGAASDVAFAMELGCDGVLLFPGSPAAVITDDGPCDADWPASPDILHLGRARIPSSATPQRETESRLSLAAFALATVFRRPGHETTPGLWSRPCDARLIFVAHLFAAHSKPTARVACLRTDIGGSPPFRNRQGACLSSRCSSTRQFVGDEPESISSRRCS